MTPINVYGLSSQDGIPTLEPLVVGYINEHHLNHVEIARNEFEKARAQWGRLYDGIILTFGNYCSVYDFKR
jgi:hypothetical protein